MIILKIALRNLMEHKAKSAIVGTLIALAVVFMVAGNSIMYSIKSGMEKSYSHNYTGDLIIHGQSDEKFSLIAMGGAAADIPQVPSYDVLLKTAESFPQTAAVLPLISGSASVSVNEESVGFTQLWGANLSEYRTMFPDSLVITQGGFPEKSGAFILLSESVRSEIEKETGKALAVGDKITLGAFGSDGTRLREAEITAFFHFLRGSATLERISIIDANTLRSLKGMTASVSDVSPETTPGVAIANSPPEISEDDLFGDATTLMDNQAPTVGSSSSINYDAILGDTTVRGRYSQVDENAWNFLLVRLTDAKYFDEAKQQLDSVIAANGIKATVSDWQWGAGTVASLAIGLQLVFNIIIVIILIVAVIIIMNTLVISVTERIPEIGTIRAIGGSRGFVRKMIVLETLVLSLLSGLVGVAVGSAAIAAINVIGIGSTNMFFGILFGGATLHPSLSGVSILWSLAATVLIGVLSSLYPMAVALKISPVKAMQKN